jgi:hypothetical protein
MATIQLYNHTAQLFASGACTDADTYKMELLSADASFDATDTILADVDNTGSYEVDGNGWTTGGEELLDVVIETITTNDARFDASDVLVEAVGGASGPYSFFVIYNDTWTDDPPLAFVTLSAAQTTAEGGVAGRSGILLESLSGL